ncbi:MAG: hypothetical protein ABI193_16830, partial [Minicystis sp.]
QLAQPTAEGKFVALETGTALFTQPLDGSDAKVLELGTTGKAAAVARAAGGEDHARGDAGADPGGPPQPRRARLFVSARARRSRGPSCSISNPVVHRSSASARVSRGMEE